MASLRLLADDLTGALDSAAAFGSPAEPVPVLWQGEVPHEGAVAYDSHTREGSESQARSAVTKAATALWGGAECIAYKKIDSLLRGHEAAEISAILKIVKPAHCVIAPAFPAQSRITRDGRQYVGGDSGWRPVPTDLAMALRACGHHIAVARPGDGVPPGTSLWDAESDEDLDAIVAAAPDDTFWIGSGGLAAALARASSPPRKSTATMLPRPVLGMIGSNHPTMLAQLQQIAPFHLDCPDGDAGELPQRLTNDGFAMVSVALPVGTSRAQAAAQIDRRLSALARLIEPPGTVIVAGGETLRGLCETLGAERLDVTGEIMPGVPHSIMRGGRWDGVAVVSKSGAFGAPSLLEQLAATCAADFAGAAA